MLRSGLFIPGHRHPHRRWPAIAFVLAFLLAASAVAGAVALAVVRWFLR